MIQRCLSLILFLLFQMAVAGQVCAGGQEEMAGGHDHHAMEKMAEASPADQNVNPDKWVTEKGGEILPLGLSFTDETGKTRTLGSIIDRPTIILPIYFYCPGICSLNLAHLAEALRDLSHIPGRDYRVIAFSFNELESSDDAARAKENYLKIVGDGFPASEWFFLTGTKETIRRLTDSLGFRFKRLTDSTFIHPSTLVITGRDGKIIRYVYGSFLAGDIDMALLDAKKGTPSFSVRRLLAFCLSYDPDKNKSLFQIIKLSVLAVFAVGLGLLFFVFRKKGRRQAKAGGDDLGEGREQKNE
ncbi:cytochrome-c oxidase [Desulfomarina profundi]|uniref:Cytochrome-c oxidase n=1 Tax=Desulfomarina profundi TaxID=2772557 RepID=A0A8D5FKW9_9BACT|nr:SCO family protein [Desulfomarina profundi]BCL60089.1 cytochrome-c oxidase [Desulfomarina profundi]